MATNIVGGLFGVSPEQLMQQRQETDASNAFRYAQLNPLQQAKMSIYQGAAGLGRVAGGLLGGDPELEKVSAIKQLSSQFDLTTAQGMREFAGALQQIAPNEAMMAAKRADELEQSSLTRQKTQADITKAELSATQEEKLRSELAALGPNAAEQDVPSASRRWRRPARFLPRSWCLPDQRWGCPPFRVGA